MGKCIAVIAAHPDDEALGCGGTIAMHAARGDEVHVIFLADGETSRGEATQEISKRQTAAQKSCLILGAEEPVFLNLPDNQLDSLSLFRVVQALEEKLLPLEAEIIYTHHGGDLNIDHQIAHRATLTACPPQPNCSVKAIYTFEILSSTGWSSSEISTDFKPLHYVDVNNTFEKKLSALECYSTEMRDFPHARSIKTITSLAEIRGSVMGLYKAEAFGIVRQIVRAL